MHIYIYNIYFHIYIYNIYLHIYIYNIYTYTIYRFSQILGIVKPQTDWKLLWYFRVVSVFKQNEVTNIMKTSITFKKNKNNHNINKHPQCYFSIIIKTNMQNTNYTFPPNRSKVISRCVRTRWKIKTSRTWWFPFKWTVSCSRGGGNIELFGLVALTLALFCFSSRRVHNNPSAAAYTHRREDFCCETFPVGFFKKNVITYTKNAKTINI